MKRDMDLIRDLLIALEAEYETNTFSTQSLPEIGSYSPKVVLAHFNILKTAGFIDRYHDAYGVGPKLDKHSITHAGYDFLDSVRDPEIWRKTKEAGRKAGGWTLELFGVFAKGLSKMKFDQLLRGDA